MISYQIVTIGGQPGNDHGEKEGAVCTAWAESADKQSTEVIAVDLATGKVVHRYTLAESERVARIFRSLRI